MAENWLTAERLRVRQAVIAATDLEAALADLRAVLDLPQPYRDPGVGAFGLGNGVLPVGDTFLEVVSPVRENTTAGRFIERQGGDSGYMVIVQTDDLARERIRIESLGVRIVWEIALENIATLHLHPADIGGAIVSLDAAKPAASWDWAGPGWQDKPRSTHVNTICAVEIHCTDPDQTYARWCEVLGVSDAELNAGVLKLSNSEIRFAECRNPGREGLRVIDFEAINPAAALAVGKERGLAVSDDSIEICGVELRLLS